MRFMNVKASDLSIIFTKFSPKQSGRMGYALVGNDIEIFAIEKCDSCDVDVRGANPITIVAPKFGILTMICEKHNVMKSDIFDEGGCNDDGDFVCSACQ